MKRRRFFFHYNKLASVAQGRNVLTVHWLGKCFLVHHINCLAAIQTKSRKSQPRCVMQGFASAIHFTTHKSGAEDALIMA